MKTLQEQIKERAKQWTIYNTESVPDKQGEQMLYLSYQQGAESMLPIMKDVAVKYQRWIDDQLFPENIAEWFQANQDKNYYDYFITNIYKP